jgi:hypothetical protein
MIKYLFLLFFSLILTCTNAGRDDSDVNKELLQAVKYRDLDIRSWAKHCGDTAAKETYNSKEVEIFGCDTGDGVLFNGLLCLSGDKKACDAVAKAQNQDTGQWFRSEFYLNSKYENSFSRDMAKGVLAYLIITKDQERANKWLSYIESHGNKLCDNDTDGRCLIPPAFWGVMKVVWEYIGLEPSMLMKLGNLGDDTTLLASAHLTPLGFHLHLVAVELHLRFHIKRIHPYLMKQLADVLVKRQPENPYFNWLASGPSDRVLRLLLDQCPKDSPGYKNQWSFERDTAEQAWLNSMGHECLFLFNLIQK